MEKMVGNGRKGGRERRETGEMNRMYSNIYSCILDAHCL